MKRFIPHWTALAKVQKISLVKNMYVWILIVPILANILVKVEGEVVLTIFGENFPIGLPFSWKIFFYSALGFSFGNLIFAWRCFPIIKNHSDFKSFEDSGKTRQHLIHYTEGTKLHNEVKDRVIEIQKREMDIFKREELFYGPVRNIKTDSDTIEKILTDKENFKQFENNAVRSTFWQILENLNAGRPIWRMLCSFLYLIGFALFSYVLYENIVAVVKLTF